MKKNKQKERSSLWIIEALFLLMKNKPFHEITITEITEKAGISRLTYYRNFNSKEDIILRYYDIMFEDFLLMFDNINKEELDLKKLIIMSFDRFEENHDQALLLIRDDLTHLLLAPFSNYITRALEKINIPSSLNYFQLKFIEGGLFYTLFNWTKDSKNYTPEQLADNILDIVKH
ncbi:TetR/AcrR family transcriptional regulator [Facklamia miroungae]|uniref:DNA-binding transcriptional regulator, AcrR family n=1 Tax=Facklamia miroungae TaxID=120956 RepID=A0A1G7UAB2_9LACT|nr:TetR/AcrR family transcriptional regulator [Facklamia miroungae]NKZ30025.1 TetR/AcrR family transcriptional regulator [Facklamia miroungae]SDG44384.1 DNA-binding transcriptional regulator, AcrR family [Facklamia miroungae]